MDQLKEMMEKVTWPHIIVIVAAAAAYFYFFQDRSQVEMRENNLQGTQSEINKVKAKVEESRQFEKQFAAKKKKLAELEAKLATKRAELPKNFNVPAMLNDFLAEARQVGLEVSNVRPAPREEKKELYYELGIDISVKGSFLQLFIFLERLSKLQRLIGIGSVTVRPVGERKPGQRYIPIQSDIKLLAFRID